MAHRLDAVLSDQRRFVADASHQLRTPLTALRCAWRTCRAIWPADGGYPDQSAVDALERAIGETERLTELVSNLLHLARADDRPATEVADLGVLVRDRVDTWTAIAEDRGVELRHTSAAEPTLVRCVPGAIEQILDNLLGQCPRRRAVWNEHRGRDRPVGPGRRSSCAVVDHGPGLPDAAKVEAMRRFWRGDIVASGYRSRTRDRRHARASSGGRVALPTRTAAASR